MNDDIHKYFLDFLELINNISNNNHGVYCSPNVQILFKNIHLRLKFYFYFT